MRQNPLLSTPAPKSVSSSAISYPQGARRGVPEPIGNAQAIPQTTTRGLSAAERDKLPAKAFLGKDKTFPITDAAGKVDPDHLRAAISGATRAYNAGNISKAERDRIHDEAMAKLTKVDSSK